MKTFDTMGTFDLQITLQGYYQLLGVLQNSTPDNEFLVFQQAHYFKNVKDFEVFREFAISRLKELIAAVQLQIALQS